MKYPLQIASFLIAFFIAPCLMAAEENSKDFWEYNLAPFYLWAINVSGDLTIGPVSNPVSVEFDDIFGNLDSAFLVHFEATRNNTWGVLIDMNYLDLEEKQSMPAGVTRRIDMDLSLAEASGYHRWSHQNHQFDMIPGLRYADISNAVSIVGAGDLTDNSPSWVDPLVGGSGPLLTTGHSSPAALMVVSRLAQTLPGRPLA